MVCHADRLGGWRAGLGRRRNHQEERGSWVGARRGARHSLRPSDGVLRAIYVMLLVGFLFGGYSSGEVGLTIMM